MPKHVKFIIEMLENNGFEAYAVGGCVRDHIMGIEPTDYDITTNALPAEIREVFADHNIASYGEKHGTVGVITGRHVVEITTYRIEGVYSDNRHPDSVSFSKTIPYFQTSVFESPIFRFSEITRRRGRARSIGTGCLSSGSGRLHMRRPRNTRKRDARACFAQPRCFI